jgi:hypothetical protein
MDDRGLDDTPEHGRIPVGGVPQQQPEYSSTDTTATFSDDLAAQLAAIDSSVSTEEREAVGSLPSGSALLVVRRGPNAGARFLLDADVTTVSRRHAQFLRHGTSFQVKDLGSLNGTYFDGVRIDTALLSDGAEVQVGKFRLTFYASRLDLARSLSK